MGFFESIFGDKKEEQTESRQNDGGNFMTVPPVPPGDMSDEEAIILENKRKEIEALESKIVEIEGNFDHPEYDNLPELRDTLAQLKPE